MSSKKPLVTGVPQGSVLGPLFLSLYVNDLPLHSHTAEIIIYADDTCIVLVPENFTELEAKANAGLDRIDKWFLANKLTVNTRKTKYAVFHSPQKVTGDA